MKILAGCLKNENIDTELCKPIDKIVIFCMNVKFPDILVFYVNQNDISILIFRS